MIGTLLSAICACSLGANEIRVDVHNFFNGGLCLGGTTTTFYDSGAPINLLNLAPCVERINVYAVGSTVHDIGRITISGDAPVLSSVEVVIGAGVLKTSSAQAYIPAGRNWGGLSVSGAIAPFIALGGGIGGDLTGSVIVAQLYRLDIEGEIQSTISATSNSALAFYVVECGSMSSSGRIQRESGDIERVDVVGNCAGEVDAIAGNLDLLSVGGDFTGTAEAATSAAGVISEIVVGGACGTDADQAQIGFRTALVTLTAGEINAVIKGPDSRFWGGAINRIETTAANSTSGRLAGSITTERFEKLGPSVLGAIELMGPFEGRIEVLRALDVNEFEVIVPAGGFEGLLVVNTSNDGWTWTAPVKVGSTSLGPSYPETSASIGGGAVGVLPFGLHGTDCEPPDDQPVAFSNRPTPMVPIEVRHYGTIAIEGTSPESAIEVHAKSPAAMDWVDQSGCVDTVGVGANATILEITPNVALQNGYTYMITTKRSGSDYVRCDLAVLTTADPVTEEPLVEDYTYEFCVGTALVSASTVTGPWT